MQGFAVVFLGAGIGGALRHGANLAGTRLLGTGFPAATLFVNVSGSLAMGLLAGWFAFRGDGAAPPWRLFLGTGVLGGYTTFSSFSLDAVALWERGQAAAAIGYVAASLALSLAGLVLGLWIMRQVAGAGGTA
ncbi:MAG TPA: fluoride efflux transporter CrcB [Crenalkalicoccus sp.]|nr:fluoride efflux transporter CrcB [Crenalkalicoccus sp.]